MSPRFMASRANTPTTAYFITASTPPPRRGLSLPTVKDNFIFYLLSRDGHHWSLRRSVKPSPIPLDGGRAFPPGPALSALPRSSRPPPAPAASRGTNPAG